MDRCCPRPTDGFVEESGRKKQAEEAVRWLPEPELKLRQERGKPMGWWIKADGSADTVINLDAVSRMYVRQDEDWSYSVWAEDGGYPVRLCRSQSRSDARQIMNYLIRLLSGDRVHTIGSVIRTAESDGTNPAGGNG